MENRIRKIMSVVFKIPIDEINRESSPDTIESWDSLRHMKLVLALENEFEIEFTESQVVEMLSYKLIEMVLKEHGVN
jgi:acyl carrier protein